MQHIRASRPGDLPSAHFLAVRLTQRPFHIGTVRSFGGMSRWNVMDFVICFQCIRSDFLLAMALVAGVRCSVQELDNILAVRVMRIFCILRGARVIRALCIHFWDSRSLCSRRGTWSYSC